MRWPNPSLFTRSKPNPLQRRFLQFEALEDRLTPAGFFLTGVGGVTDPIQPNVRIYDSSIVSGGSTTFLNPPGDIGAFSNFGGSVRVANGDVNGDGIDDFITAQGGGAGSGSQVNIYDGASALFSGTSVLISSFYAYSDSAGASQNPGFAGGVFVAAADLNGDGFAELVVSAGAGARGHIKVFNFNDGSGNFLGSAPELRSSFFAYTDFAGEIRVTTLKAGPTTYIVTGSGAGTSQSDVRFYQGAFDIGQVPDLTFLVPAAQIFPFAGYTGGVSVAAGDTDRDGVDELFVSKNSGTSTVDVFDIRDLTSPKYQFAAFGGFNGEVRLGAADVDGDGKVEVLTSTGDSPGAGGAHVKAWSLTGGPTTLRSFFAYEGYSQGVFLSTNDFHWRQSFYNPTTVTIPDNNVISTSIVVDARTSDDVHLRPKTITVSLNIAGTSNSDLDVFIQGTNAVQVELFSGVNGNGHGMQIQLTDSATTSIVDAPVGGLLTGTFRPDNLSLIDTYGTASVAGTWYVNVRDHATGNVSQLLGWGVTFTF